MSKAIVTLASDDKYKVILAETIGQMRKYAAKIGAELIVATSDDPSFRVPHYRKLKLITEALRDFERVAWIDCDVLISDRAPSIFSEVPEGQFGIFNEAPWIDRQKDAETWADMTGFLLPANTYYNTGVMVAGREHASIFKVPDQQVAHFGEQTFLNQRIAEEKPLVHKLSHHWNRMSCTHMPLGEEPFVSNFIHFAGESHNSKLPEFIKQTLSFWENKEWTGDKTIAVFCNNGMGNQIATVPVIRYLARVHPDYKIVIVSAFKEVFQHLTSDNISVIDPSGVIKSKFALNKSTALVGSIVDVATHPTDYHAISLLQRQLPLDNRQITVPTKPCGKKLPSNTVVIHAGKSGWESKEMPEENWQKIVDILKENDLPVAIIGARVFNATVGERPWGCFVPKGVDFDFTDKPFAETCDVIKQGAFLLSNDSMPIHAAGAFRNWIGLVTIAKRPELILPYRLMRGPSLMGEITQTEKVIAWTGTPLWEVTKEPIIIGPDEPFTWTKMHEGMRWPEPELIASDIIQTLKRA